ncbi:MAG: hypothetical protein JSU87_04080 [Gemmatimonadota bacterium]|nr:MAG: hypothetical protein JSU87_04080 [Gemmatimonadota bacterium]
MSSLSVLSVAALVSLSLAAVAGTRLLADRGTDMIDSGNFTLFQGGVRIGEERFVIHSDRAGDAGPIFRARADLSLKLEGQTMRVNVALEALGTACRPRRYEAKVDGPDAMSVVTTFAGNRMTHEFRTSAGYEREEALVRGKAVILDRNIAHHYFFAGRLADCETSGVVNVIVPRDRYLEQARIVDRGVDSQTVEGRALELHHLEIISSSGTSRHVWLDGDRVIKIEVPEEGFMAVRSRTATQPTN